MKRWILALLLVFSAAQLPAATPFPEAVSTSTTTLTLQPTVGVYTFTGSSPATWTLPAVSQNQDRQIIIKNRGSATITVQRAGSDQLYTTSAVTSTTVSAGGWAKLVNDGVYWAVLTAGSGGLASTDIDTSAELAGILTDETGSGAAVFGTSPTFDTSINIGGNCLLYPDGSNVLSLRNGANAQAFNIYNTWGNSGTNYERLSLYWSGNIGYLTTGKGGTGAGRHLRLDTSASGDLYLGTAGTLRYFISGNTGMFTPAVTNTYDLGNSSLTFARGYFGTSLIVGAGSNVQVVANRNALTDYGRFMVQQNGTDKWGIGSRGDEAANNMLIFRDETNGSNVLSLYQGASGASQIAMIGSVQNQQAQKTLTKASATAFVQVAVPSNGYVGGIVHYTLISSDGTDYQSRGGSIPFSAVNKGGIETCNFGTQTDTSATSSGTITITAFDADTSPTNAVNLRCNATTSFASPSTFALRYWVEISGSPVPVTPQ